MLEKALQSLLYPQVVTKVDKIRHKDQFLTYILVQNGCWLEGCVAGDASRCVPISWLQEGLVELYRH